jgi:hypothetical protein
MMNSAICTASSLNLVRRYVSFAVDVVSSSVMLKRIQRFRRWNEHRHLLGFLVAPFSLGMCMCLWPFSDPMFLHCSPVKSNVFSFFCYVAFVVSCFMLFITPFCKKRSCPPTRHAGALVERRYGSCSVLTSALDWCEWSLSRPGRALRRGKTPGAYWIGGWWAQSRPPGRS